MYELINRPESLTRESLESLLIWTPTRESHMDSWVPGYSLPALIRTPDPKNIYEGSKNFEKFPTENLHFSTLTLRP